MLLKGKIDFYECEHNGDLDNYIEDMVSCGAKIISRELDYDGEVGSVEFEVVDMKEFMSKFEETDSYDFVN